MLLIGFTAAALAAAAAAAPAAAAACSSADAGLARMVARDTGSRHNGHSRGSFRAPMKDVRHSLQNWWLHAVKYGSSTSCRQMGHSFSAPSSASPRSTARAAFIAMAASSLLAISTRRCGRMPPEHAICRSFTSDSNTIIRFCTDPEALYMSNVCAQ